MNFCVKNLINFLKMNLLGGILVALSVFIYILLDICGISSFAIIMGEVVVLVIVWLFICLKRKYLVFTKQNIIQSIISGLFVLFTLSWIGCVTIFFIVVVYSWGKIAFYW